MNIHLENIKQLLQDESLPEDKKQLLLKAFTEADKQWAITDFKLDRTEKVKRTTAILLEETIEELEQKRKAVEAQNRELEIESSLERVRTAAMAMKQPADMLEVCRLISDQLQMLQVKNLRNVQTAIIEESKGIYLQYEYYTLYKKTSISEVSYNEHPKVLSFVNEIRKASDAFFTTTFKVAELLEWRKHRNNPNLVPDPKMEEVDLIYYYYYSIGPGVLGVSTYALLNDNELAVFKRFRNVFELAYRRYTDIEKAEAQAREAQIEASLERVRSRSMAMHKSEELKEVIQVVYEQFVHLNINTQHTGFVMDYKVRDDRLIWVAGKHGVPSRLTIPYFDCEYYNRFNEAKEKGWDFFATNLGFEEKNSFYQELFTYIPGLPEEDKEFYFTSPGLAISTVLLENVALYIENFEGIPYSDEDNNTLMRFGKVFQQTYTRFLDLQKAEAQAREAKIETALERVRSRTMAMQKSDELTDVAGLLFAQVNALGFKPWTAGFNVWSEDNNSFVDYITSPNGGFIKPYTVHTEVTEIMTEVSDARKSGEEFFVQYAEGEKLKKAYLALSKFGDEKQYEIMLEDGFQFPSHQYDHFVFGSKVSLMFITYEPVPEAHDIFKRLGKVFEQTYTRFLDLQKAEAQAREAQIELGLERVRARAMAMQKSDELKELIATVFAELTKLDLVLTRCLIMIYDPQTNDSTWWMANSEAPADPIGLFVKYHEHPPYQAYIKGWKEKNLKWQYILEGKVKEEWDKFLFVQTELSLLPDFVIEGMKAPGRVHLSASFNNFGNLTLASLEPLSGEHFDILLRFAKVFDLTYTRFNDLKQAEGQAREAQIEVSLERVRSKAMAMQKSDDLANAVAIVFEELDKLGLGTIRCGIAILDRDKRSADLWTAAISDQGTIAQVSGDESMDIHPLLQGAFDAWQQLKDYSYLLQDEDLTGFYKALSSANYKLPDSQFIDEPSKELQQHLYVAHFPAGGLYVFREASFTEEAKFIVRRFADVFNLTYTRFNDLRQAEEQAREAKIEASLERVRGKAMAMHSSEDLAGTINVFYHEMGLLSITPRRCGVGLLDKETHIAELSTMNTTAEGSIVEIVGKLKMAGHAVLEAIYDNWLLQKEYHPILKGNEIKEYYQLIKPQISFPDYPDDVVQYGYFFFFPEGGVYAWTDKELAEEELKIYRKFTTVLSLTYKRYKDLKDAEARTQVAIRQASLDRIRAEIASMRTSEDLQRITPLVWRELTELDIPFFRCGVFIINEREKKIHAYLSTPEGKSVAVLHLDFDSSETTGNTVEYWRQQKVYREHWNSEQFMAWVHSLIGQGQITTPQSYQAGNEPPESLTLQFVPFVQGMMYVGSANPLSDAQVELVQSVAEAFSVAYARYEDFNNLEAAKEQVESALKELRSTQSQLIQSEKMASLGELTAGIAHEIQNPLNFVNNFSEVSNELISEMVDEVDKGNTEEVKAIAKDVQLNLEKILHHGKRADGIVKGMLQHSRRSTGVKEPTDINALVDEYLRLAYHGLRAKDNSFNATLKTDYDETIGNINIIPQDIGRVLLNLYNNAFYAVSEKKKQQVRNYEPTVSIKTKKLDDKIEVSVKDNGNGIPQKVLDKIFQPFFTTKPTGQGTGLGLSLSYDIVKAHGGKLKVETLSAEAAAQAGKEGEGSEFIIQLPFV